MKSITTILLVITGIVLLGWVARPLWDNISTLRGESANIESVLSTLNQKKQIQQDLITTYNSISDQQLDLLLHQHLPKKPDTGTLLVALERMAQLSFMQLNNVDFKKIAPARNTSTIQTNLAKVPIKAAILPYQTLTFSFTATGSYENFKAFLGALENHIRLVDITNISFTGGLRESYTFTLTGNAYYRQ